MRKQMSPHSGDIRSLRFAGRMPKGGMKSLPPHRSTALCAVVLLRLPSALFSSFPPPTPRPRRHRMHCASADRSAIRASRTPAAHGAWPFPESSGSARQVASGLDAGCHVASSGYASTDAGVIGVCRSCSIHCMCGAGPGRCAIIIRRRILRRPMVNVAQSVELLVVVQAVEGSSPSVHPPGDRDTLRVWRNWQTR